MLKAVRAKQYLDVNTGRLIPNAIILIENERIVQIDPQVFMPTNTQILDLPDLTILPGLIDCHTHITYHYDSNGRFGFTEQSYEEILQGGQENLKKTLLAGFTTIRDVGASNGLDFALRNLHSVGPQLLVSGEPIFSPNDNVIERIEKGPDVIKVFNGMKDESQANFNSRHIRSIVNLANQHGLPVAVHSFEAISTVESSNGGASTIEHGSFITDQAAEIMAQNKTTLIPTLSMPRHYLANRNRYNFSQDNWAHFEKAAKEGISSIALAKRHGVNIVFGTDSVAGMHGNNANEFILLQEAGLSPLEAIQTATINAANALRIHDIGQIAPGYKADLIGIRGNPLKNLSLLLPENVVWVMKDGKVVKS